MTDQVKLLLAYDIRGNKENSYRRFMVEEFLPKVQELGLAPTDAWHTAYGSYPNRLVGLVADDLATMRRARASDEWKTLMKQLAGYADEIKQRVVPFRGGFQW